MSSGVDAIAEERWRQRVEEGWALEHDDTHDKGEMARAAACYAWASTLSDFDRELGAKGCWPDMQIFRRLWPWNRQWWKPKDRRRDLVRAGALIAAEIERLDRLDG